MNKFKPGDVVKCIDNYGTQDDLKTGWLYTVSRIDFGALLVLNEREFEKYGSYCASRFELVERGYRAPKHDQVNNPSHYQIMTGVEVIDVRRALIDKIPAGANLNAVDEWSRAWEYLTRAWSKNGLEDFKKAQVYLGWLIERLEAEDKIN
jgi:hypothetical protein